MGSEPDYRLNYLRKVGVGFIKYQNVIANRCSKIFKMICLHKDN